MPKKMTKTIKKRLIEQELTITELAKIIKRSRVYTSNVINGHFKSEATLTLVCQALGLKVEDLQRGNSDHNRAA